MLQLGLLASGHLGNEIFKRLKSKYFIAFVLTDTKSENIIHEAKQSNIKCFVGNPRKGKGYEFIKNTSIDVLVSVNYIYLIENGIINHAKRISFNMHGSLLPKYRGRTPHVWAIINNEKKTGVTAHRIETGCDTGAIIEQITIPISDTDTGNDILMKFEKEYPNLVEKVLNSIENDTIKFYKQNEEKATFFGKRIPDDGQINWDWQRERIYNWVRAQAYPYPGAFTFYKGEKVIIDNVSFSDYNFSWEDSNGIILMANPDLIVKTPNGAIIINSIRNISEITNEFVKGKKFELL